MCTRALSPPLGRGGIFSTTFLLCHNTAGKLGWLACPEEIFLPRTVSVSVRTYYHCLGATVFYIIYNVKLGLSVGEGRECGWTLSVRVDDEGLFSAVGTVLFAWVELLLRPTRLRGPVRTSVDHRSMKPA